MNKNKKVKNTVDISAKLFGKTKQEIISILGEGFHPDSNDDVLIYVVRSGWFGIKKKILHIEFNHFGITDTVYILNNYDFKKQ